jgi:manganese transport protein
LAPDFGKIVDLCGTVATLIDGIRIGVDRGFLHGLTLGIATERDLAQMCREHYSRPVSMLLWIGAEIAIAACDLAEVIGSAIALQLLFGIPLILGIVITSVDVLLILLLQHRGFRYLEGVVIVLIGTVALLFGIEVALSRPEWAPLLVSFTKPARALFTDPDMLYISITILGATVMPHNLYLHSSIVQTRRYARSAGGKTEAIRFANIDSAASLTLALFVNAAILIIAAAAGSCRSERSVCRGSPRIRSELHHRVLSENGILSTLRTV